MKVLHTHDEAGQDEPDCFLLCVFEVGESGGIIADESVSVTALSPLHYEVEVDFIAECVVEGGDEVVFALLQNSFLQL